jgi:hypothetical protein
MIEFLDHFAEPKPAQPEPAAPPPEAQKQQEQPAEQEVKELSLSEVDALLEAEDVALLGVYSHSGGCGSRVVAGRDSGMGRCRRLTPVDA